MHRQSLPPNSPQLHQRQPSAPVVAETTPAASEQPTIRKIDGPEVAPLNLLDTAGSTIAKRAIPALIGIAVLVVVLVKLI